MCATHLDVISGGLDFLLCRLVVVVVLVDLKMIFFSRSSPYISHLIQYSYQITQYGEEIRKTKYLIYMNIYKCVELLLLFRQHSIRSHPRPGIRYDTKSHHDHVHTICIEQSRRISRTFTTLQGVEKMARQSNNWRNKHFVYFR